jgi:hypothetical protein
MFGIAWLGPFLLSIAGSLVARVLLSLGMGFVSYAVLTSLASTVTQAIQSSYYALPAVPLALLNLAGLGVALNIICSALITRAGLMAVKKLVFL